MYRLHTLGAKMMDIALNKYDSYSNNGTAGFKEKLVGGTTEEYRQGVGVYSHVIGVAGATLWGGYSGDLIVIGKHLQDVYQTKRGDARQQSEGPAEQQGNIAGVKVGELMKGFIASGGGSIKDLKDKLSSILCDQ
jgi:hypothetical protein